MNLLFLAPNPPSPVRVRPYQLAQQLAARGHRLTVAAPLGGEDEARDLAGLQELAAATLGHRIARQRRVLSVAEGLLSRRPLQAAVAWDPRFARRLAAEVEAARVAETPYSIAHIEHLRAARYALALQPHLPVVWDSVDSITLLFEQALAQSRSLKGRLLAAVDLRRTQRYEGYLVNRLGSVVVTAQADRRRLLELAEADRRRRHDDRGGNPGNKGSQSRTLEPRICVIPNGVDLARFAARGMVREPDTIVLSGKMSYHANVTAACFLVEDVMPRVWARRPDARVVLAGAEPSREVRALARRDARVEVTGFVEDLGAVLSRATVAVAPLVYGAGIQNKILEAMATETPVVASELAARSIGVAAGRELLVGRSAVDMAEGLVSMLEDPERAKAMGAAGRAYVERHHSWEAAAQAFETVYAEAAALFTPSPSPHFTPGSNSHLQTTLAKPKPDPNPAPDPPSPTRPR